MSYICDACGGEGKNGWCVPCGKTIECDCKNKTHARFKDLIYDCDNGERTVTVRVYHCETCGIISRIE